MDPVLMYLIFKSFVFYAYARGASMMSSVAAMDTGSDDDSSPEDKMRLFLAAMVLGIAFSFSIVCLYLAGVWSFEGIGSFIGTLLLGIIHILPRVIFTGPGKLIVGIGKYLVRVGNWVSRLPDAGRNLHRPGRDASHLWPAFAHVETYIPATYVQSLLRRLRHMGAVQTTMLVLSEGPLIARDAHALNDEALYQESLRSRRNYILYELSGLHRAFKDTRDEHNAALVGQLLSGVQTAFGEAEVAALRAIRQPRRGRGVARGFNRG